MDEPKPSEVMWNMSRTRIGGDIAGVIAVIGSIVVLVTGIPPFKWSLVAALACGGVCAFALSYWHRRHPAPGKPPNTVDGR